jgi:hypothetical protein
MRRIYISGMGQYFLSKNATKSARLRRWENRAALARRPHFLSAFSLFAARCLPVSPPCCFAAGKPVKALTSKA